MTIAVDPTDGPYEYAMSASATTTAAVREPVRRLPGIAIAGMASIGAGAIHAAAIGIHAEHRGLAQIFVVCAVLQLGTGLLALLRPSRPVAVATAAVNAGAVIGWLVTRITGISWIGGLETAEAPQFADSACALLGAVAVGAALSAAMVGWHMARPPRLLMPGLAALALTVPAMVSGGTHVHSHDDGAAHDHTATAAAVDPATGDTVAGAAHDDGHAHDEGSPAAAPAGAGAATDTTEHSHATETTVAVEEGAAPWPRPWDPAEPIDLSGVQGVTPEQEARALALVEGSLRELPRFATVAAATAAGYTSIGDAGTGSEHYIRYDLVQDDVMLDPTAPESLVYTVKGDERILAGAMYIASARPTDDPSLTDWAGGLMQWHNHGDLCWDRVNGVNAVVGVLQADGTCARGINTGGANPMVHVWITPHECGVFAALEGVGAGQTSVSEEERVDKCQEGHDHGAAAPVEPKPYDPTKPIDLSGTPGVTPEQQAAAENLIAVTLVRLPQWSDHRDAEAAGFQSIGDAATGHEHFINWDWINDDVVLDPDQPESLVYEPQPDGSKKLVSAMYMLPDDVALEDVPDIGGALMQWHIHDNLCFTTGDAPKVAGLVDGQGNCRAGLQKFRPSAMIHVWITPHRCGPFAALEGVGAGSIVEGEERLCDHAHGEGF
jgi:hypothetical protein